MKTLNEYRNIIRTMLGDQTGRRYSDEIIDLGLKEALQQTGRYIPKRETVRVRVTESDGSMICLQFVGEPGTILTARNGESGEWLGFSEYVTGTKTYLTIYEGQKPAVGGTVLLELSAAQTIKDLDGAVITSLPSRYTLSVCKWAAGIAMEIRARSVTEVFGKRPEDTDRLLEQAARLKETAETELETASTQSAGYLDPFPRRGWAGRKRH